MHDADTVGCTRGTCAHWKAPPCHGAYPLRTLPLRDSGYAHPLCNPLASGKERRIAAQWISPKATNGEIWIKRKPFFHNSSCLIYPPEMRKRGGKKKFGEGIVGRDG